MRYGCKFTILFLSLIITANSSYSQYEPKRPAVRVEQPEISFNLVQASDGVVKVRMTNNGKNPFRFHNSFTPQYRGYPSFRVCDRELSECDGKQWISYNFWVSSLIRLPAELSELEPGSSIVKTIHIPSTFSIEGVYSIVGGYDQKPGDLVEIQFKPSDHLQIKFEVMLTPYFEKYIEYVSEWIPVETLMRP